jgi:hypothetical protein
VGLVSATPRDATRWPSGIALPPPSPAPPWMPQADICEPVTNLDPRNKLGEILGNSRRIGNTNPTGKESEWMIRR